MFLLRDPARAEAVQIARMDRFWGDGSWREVAYEVSRQGSLFGEPEPVKVEDANERISDAYGKRLMRNIAAAYAPRPLRFVLTASARQFTTSFSHLQIRQATRSSRTSLESIERNRGSDYGEQFPHRMDDTSGIPSLGARR